MVGAGAVGGPAPGTRPRPGRRVGRAGPARADGRRDRPHLPAAPAPGRQGDASAARRRGAGRRAAGGRSSGRCERCWRGALCSRAVCERPSAACQGRRGRARRCDPERSELVDHHAALPGSRRAFYFAYVQQLAEMGELPKYSASLYSPEEAKVLEDLNHKNVRFNPAVGTISTPAQHRKLGHDLALPLARHGVGEAGVATAEPPLYYALQTIPYLLGSGGTSAGPAHADAAAQRAAGGLSPLCSTYLFLREAPPGAPWAWTVGGLAVALSPVCWGFISGGVNPDAMLFAVSAALFLLLGARFPASG